MHDDSALVETRIARFVRERLDRLHDRAVGPPHERLGLETRCHPDEPEVDHELPARFTAPVGRVGAQRRIETTTRPPHERRALMPR